MLGHVFRSPENSPAQSALCFAVDAMNSMPGRMGWHRINLSLFIKKNLQQHDIKVSSYEDVIELIELARNRNAWRDMYKPVT
jgi:hypothetical protein